MDIDPEGAALRAPDPATFWWLWPGGFFKLGPLFLIPVVWLSFTLYVVAAAWGSRRLKPARRPLRTAAVSLALTLLFTMTRDELTAAEVVVITAGLAASLAAWTAAMATCARVAGEAGAVAMWRDVWRWLGAGLGLCVAAIAVGFVTHGDLGSTVAAAMWIVGWSIASMSVGRRSWAMAWHFRPVDFSSRSRVARWIEGAPPKRHARDWAPDRT